MSSPAARSFCYVLTDPELGNYAAMTAVSAAATRLLHPDTPINVVCDAATATRLTTANHVLLKYATRIVSVDTPYAEVKLQSRFLKTTLRKQLAGDFVFLDSDAVPMRNLERLFDWDGEFGIVIDSNAPTGADSLQAGSRAELERMNWPIPSMYFNSGVFLARDVPTVHRLFEQWHERWLQYVASGRHQDQLSLNSILMTSGVKLAALPHSYNAQISAREEAIRGAHIVHFYLSFGGLDETVFAGLVDETKRTGQVNVDGLRAFLRSRNPWTSRDSMRRYYWTGHPFLAVGVAMRKAVAKLGGR